MPRRKGQSGLDEAADILRQGACRGGKALAQRAPVERAVRHQQRRGLVFSGMAFAIVDAHVHETTLGAPVQGLLTERLVVAELEGARRIVCIGAAEPDDKIHVGRVKPATQRFAGDLSGVRNFSQHGFDRRGLSQSNARQYSSPVLYLRIRDVVPGVFENLAWYSKFLRCLTLIMLIMTLDPNYDANYDGQDGQWLVVLTRPLGLGNSDDKALKDGGVYHIGFAVHDDPNVVFLRRLVDRQP